MLSLIGISVIVASLSFIGGMGFSSYLHEKYNIRYLKGEK